MTEQLVAAPLLVPLVTAVVTLVAGRSATVQRAASALGVFAYAAAVALLVREVLAGPGRVLVYRLGDWAPPYGIVLVADSLSAFMLALAAPVAVACLLFSLRQVDAFGQRLSYHPLFHFMLVGVSGAFLTGDVFNLFVWFEVMLMSSYVLVVFYSGPEHTRAAMKYVFLNLLGSAVMLLAVGGLYATTGTLNMAHMADRLAAAGANGIPLPSVLGLSTLLFAVFALKAGIVPFQFWVPDAYDAAPAPVAAMLAGVVKKVGVYAVVRFLFTVLAGASLSVSFPGIGGDSLLSFYGPVLFVMATASVLLGGAAAVSRPSLERVFAYSSIGQVGFIVLPLAVGAVVPDPDLRALAVAATLVYALNHALAKSLLFLAAGTVTEAADTSRLPELGGLATRAPVLSAAVFVGVLGLVGIPPLSGFFAKLLVFDVAVRGGDAAVVGVALVGAVLTIAYVTRTWNRGFWGPVRPAVERADPDAAEVAVLVALAGCVVGVGVGFDPVFSFAHAAADAAVHSGPYVEAVLHGGGHA